MFGRFVEARLTEIRTNVEDKHAELVVERADWQETIKLCGVRRLLVNEFRETNVIDRIELLSDGCDRDQLRELVSSLLASSESNLASLKSVMEEEYIAVLSGRRLAIDLQPVYGASLIAIVDSIMVGNVTVAKAKS